MRGARELAEGIGTFALVFAGCGAIMIDATTGALGHVGISMTFGLVIGAMIYAVGHVSGAHFNPAVTLAFAATSHFPWRRLPSYWAAQLLGGAVAAVILVALLGPVAAVGATVPASWVSDWELVTWEFLITAILMFVIASVATDGRALRVDTFKPMQMTGFALGHNDRAYHGSWMDKAGDGTHVD